MKLGVSLAIALVVVGAVNAYLTYRSITFPDGAYQRYCIDGVSYVHVNNGPTIQRDKDGSVGTCTTRR